MLASQQQTIHVCLLLVAHLEQPDAERQAILPASHTTFCTATSVSLKSLLHGWRQPSTYMELTLTTGALGLSWSLHVCSLSAGVLSGLRAALAVPCGPGSADRAAARSLQACPGVSGHCSRSCIELCTASWINLLPKAALFDVGTGHIMQRTCSAAQQRSAC